MKIITLTMEQVQHSRRMGCKIPYFEGNALGVDICANVGAFEETFSGNAGTVGVTTGTPAAGATVVGIDNGGGSSSW